MMDEKTEGHAQVAQKNPVVLLHDRTPGLGPT